MNNNLHFITRCGVGLGLLLGLGGCVEPYVPAVLDAPASLLVVDGFINGNGRTRIKLARTASLAAPTTAAPPVEKGAKLFVVDEAGTRYALSEQTAGFYRSDSLVLPAGRQYQLRITTAAGATYASALVPLKVTPPISKLAWQLNGSDLTLTLSTQDPTQQARYYRWRATETWQFNSNYQSTLEYRDGVIKDRITPIYTCWRTEQPSAIKQGTSAQLSQDALTDVALFTYPALTERFKVRYSLLITQYAETPEEFAYLELLRKNTEAVGTVNDPLPSQLTGNVRRTDANPTEPVLGFVSAHTIQQKRLFIDRAELPQANDYEFASPYADCSTVKELFKDSINNRRVLEYPNTKLFANENSVPLNLIIFPDTPGGDLVKQGYTGSSRYCTDCRARGTTVKPSFW